MLSAISVVDKLNCVFLGIFQIIGEKENLDESDFQVGGSDMAPSSSYCSGKRQGELGTS